MPRKGKGPAESSIAGRCIQLMELDGWKAIDTDPKWLRGLAVSEIGIGDTLFVRYDEISRNRNVSNIRRAIAEVLWVEWKKIGGKYSREQHAWHDKERRAGALTWKADEDFEPSVDGYWKHYNDSGLARKRITI